MTGYYYCHRCNARVDSIAGCRCILPYHRQPTFAANDYAKQWVETKPNQPQRAAYELRYTFWLN